MTKNQLIMDDKWYSCYRKLVWQDQAQTYQKAAHHRGCRLLKNAKEAAHALGINDGIDLFMTLSFMSLPVIPTLRLTTRDVPDAATQKYI